MKKIIHLSLVLLLSTYCFVSASIFIKTQNKSFPADTTFDDDLYLAGNSVRFESQINGDLIGVCRYLVYSGQSQGNINLAAQQINVIGPVSGSIRAFAQSVEINSTIGRNLIAFAQSINIGPATDIGRDASLFGGQITFEGTVRGDMRADCERLKISGVVDGNLKINAVDFEISPNSVINGDLIYKSPTEAKIPAGTVVRGETKWIKLEPEERAEKYHAFRSITALVIGFMIINIISSLIIFLLYILIGNTVIIPLMYLSLIACGLIILGLNKNKATKCVAIMRERPWVSLGLGFVIILILPLAIGVAMITLIGIPMAVLILFGSGIALFIGAVYTALYIGSFLCKLVGIKKQEPSIVCLVIGIIVLATLSLIPVLGFLIIALALMFGLGSTVLSFELFRPQKISEILMSTDSKEK